MTYTGSYPLDWPAGWQRTAWRERSKFKTISLTHSIDLLELELDRLGASDVVISTDALTDRYGRIIGQQRKPEDPGAAVYFRYDGGEYVMAADLHPTLPDNIRALTYVIEAIRSLDRRGIPDVVTRVLQGFTALPAGSSAVATIDPYAVLELEPRASLADVKAKYRELVRRHHPDAGGTAEEFHTIQSAYDRILADRGVSV